MNCARWREPDLTAVATLKSEVLQARCNNTPTRYTAEKTIKAHIQHTDTAHVYLYVHEPWEAFYILTFTEFNVPSIK